MNVVVCLKIVVGLVQEFSIKLQCCGAEINFIIVEIILIGDNFIVDLFP